MVDNDLRRPSLEHRNALEWGKVLNSKQNLGFFQTNLNINECRGVGYCTQIKSCSIIH